MKLLAVLIVAVAVLSGAGFYYATQTAIESQTPTITSIAKTSIEKLPTNIVLVGWDGAQRDHLKEMIGRGEVPNLMVLAKEGTLVDIDVTTGATDTKAGWSQIRFGKESPGKISSNQNHGYKEK